MPNPTNFQVSLHQIKHVTCVYIYIYIIEGINPENNSKIRRILWACQPNLLSYRLLSKYAAAIVRFSQVLLPVRWTVFPKRLTIYKLSYNKCAALRVTEVGCWFDKRIRIELESLCREPSFFKLPANRNEEKPKDPPRGSLSVSALQAAGLV